MLFSLQTYKKLKIPALFYQDSKTVFSFGRLKSAHKSVSSIQTSTCSSMLYQWKIWLIKSKLKFLLPQYRMKQYSMLAGALLLMLTNVYGIVIATVIAPLTPVILVISSFVILVLLYIEICKKRILLDSFVRQSFVLFALIILCEIYFTVMAFTVLVYLNQYQEKDGNISLHLDGFIAGLGVKPVGEVSEINLPYYFMNFLSFIYYLRCFYVMFWRDNIVFIFRYLKAHVKHLNQSLLAHLPKLQVTAQIKECTCSLCLQEYKEEEEVTRLKCQHVFHLGCIKIWVLKSNACPLCRKKVVYH